MYPVGRSFIPDDELLPNPRPSPVPPLVSQLEFAPSQTDKWLAQCLQDRTPARYYCYGLKCTTCATKKDDRLDYLVRTGDGVYETRTVCRDCKQQGLGLGGLVGGTTLAPSTTGNACNHCNTPAKPLYRFKDARGQHCAPCLVQKAKTDFCPEIVARNIRKWTRRTQQDTRPAQRNRYPADYQPA